MRTLRLLIGAALLVLADTASAQAWPTRPVRVIVGFATGVQPDVMLRFGMDLLSRRIGQQVVVENITGGGGLIAAQAAVRAAPDGHTLYMGGVGLIATDQYLFKKLPYDPDKSFVPVSMIYVSGGVFAIAVHPDIKVQSIPELIKLAKSNPGKLSYGTDTIGVTAIVGQWFTKQAGVDILPVPYKSPAQLMQDFIAGRTQVAITTTANMEPFRKTGRFRIIGVSSVKRMPGFEDIPTIAETIPNFKMYGLGILVAPAATPPEIVQKINHEMDAVIKDPAYAKRLAGFNYLPMDGAGTAKSIAEFIAEEREYWGTIMKGLNVQPQ